jgi:hypothetical protein
MLVFIHIEKTGGRSLRYILRSSYGTRHCEVEPDSLLHAPPFSSSDLKLVRKVYPKLASIAAHRITGYVDLDEPGTEFRYFTFLRDPLKMSASRYQYHLQHKKRKKSFEEWLEQEAVRNAQVKLIGGTPNAEDALRVIRDKEVLVGLAEQFDESLVLLQALRAPDLDIAYTSVNVARGSTVAKDLLSTPKMCQALVEANQGDLELFEYARQELFPALRREYGPSLDDAVGSFRRERHRGFNRRRLALSRMKQYALYRPLVRLHQRRARRAAADEASHRFGPPGAGHAVVPDADGPVLEPGRSERRP